MKQIGYIVFAFSLLCCTSAKKSVVSGEAAAIEITQDTLRKLLTTEEFESYMPLKAKLSNDKTWEVKPVDIAEFAGLTPIVFIERKSGKIKKILWGEGSID